MMSGRFTEMQEKFWRAGWALDTLYKHTSELELELMKCKLDNKHLRDEIAYLKNKYENQEPKA